MIDEDDPILEKAIGYATTDVCKKSSFLLDKGDAQAHIHKIKIS